MKYINNRLNANIIKLEDANNNYTSGNVEGALEEVSSQIKDKANRVTTDSFENILNFGVVGDGITDDSKAFFDALTYCNSNKKTLIINNLIINLKTVPYSIDDDVTFLISCNIKSTNSKIIVNLNSANKNGSFFGISGNDLKIDGLHIENCSDYKNRWFLINFYKNNNVILDNCYICDDIQRDDNLEGITTGFIDFSTQNSNIQIINSTLINRNSISGGIWIREGTNGCTSKNIVIENNKIIHSCCNESIAVWGWKGKVENIFIRNNNFIEEKRTQTDSICIFTLHQSGQSNNIIFSNNNITIEDECEFLNIFLQRFPETSGTVNILNNTINMRLSSKLTSSNGLFNGFNSSKDIIKDNLIIIQNGTNQSSKFLLFNMCKNVFNNKIICNELTDDTSIVISNLSYLSDNYINSSVPIAIYGEYIPLFEKNTVYAPSAINNYFFNAKYNGSDDVDIIFRSNYIDIQDGCRLNFDCNNKENLYFVNNYMPRMTIQSRNYRSCFIACNNILNSFSTTQPTVNYNNNFITT